jgi:rhomboid protease GluP
VNPPAPESRPPVYATPAAPGPRGRLAPRGWLEEAPVTRSLLALNLGVYAVEVLLTRTVTDLPSRAALELGACNSLAVIGDHRFETLVTACFLHAGILHVGFNMLALWQAGPLVERSAGSARMAPMYLIAGALGNVASVAYGWITRSVGFSVGASGAISGVIAAALVLGWRTQGWRGPITQAMVRWLGFVLVFGFLTNLTGGRIDNAAHVGGALTGGVIASLWTRGYRYSQAMTDVWMGVSATVLIVCITLVAWRDRTDIFAAMMLQDRVDYTHAALYSGRCRDAREGLAAVERLRGSMAHVTSLRMQVDASCGPEAP